ncbi:MAG: hypothetical protein ACRDI2_03755, partial [Chloroflexota bacterium]
MAWAVCNRCTLRVPWDNHRGARLGARRCPTCGGKLTSYRHPPTLREPVPATYGVAGAAAYAAGRLHGYWGYEAQPERYPEAQRRAYAAGFSEGRRRRPAPAPVYHREAG